MMFTHTAENRSVSYVPSKKRVRPVRFDFGTLVDGIVEARESGRDGAI
ncbi:MAG: hypothetical protein ACXADO_05565 [Candidatus Thorarchaeota archaeon]